MVVVFEWKKDEFPDPVKELVFNVTVAYRRVYGRDPYETDILEIARVVGSAIGVNLSDEDISNALDWLVRHGYLEKVEWWKEREDYPRPTLIWLLKRIVERVI